MTGSTKSDSAISVFTLALFEGTGWYSVDYAMAETFTWGQGKGCSFVSGSCVSGSPPQANFEEFCSNVAREGCTHTGKSIAVCGSQVFAYNTDMDSSFDYWEDSTAMADGYADNCPYMMNFINCEDSLNQLNAALSGEFYGSQSRCFSGSLSADQAAADYYTGFCFKSSVRLMIFFFI